MRVQIRVHQRKVRVHVNCTKKFRVLVRLMEKLKFESVSLLMHAMRLNLVLYQIFTAGLYLSATSTKCGKNQFDHYFDLDKLLQIKSNGKSWRTKKQTQSRNFCSHMPILLKM